KLRWARPRSCVGASRLPFRPIVTTTMGEGAEMMKVNARIARGVVAGTAAVALGACSQLGGVLGGILPSSGTQVTATIRSVDTRAQVISLQQSNGQTLGVNYDN